MPDFFFFFLVQNPFPLLWEHLPNFSTVSLWGNPPPLGSCLTESLPVQVCRLVAKSEHVTQTELSESVSGELESKRRAQGLERGQAASWGHGDCL